MPRGTGPRDQTKLQTRSVPFARGPGRTNDYLSRMTPKARERHEAVLAAIREEAAEAFAANPGRDYLPPEGVALFRRILPASRAEREPRLGEPGKRAPLPANSDRRF